MTSRDESVDEQAGPLAQPPVQCPDCAAILESGGWDGVNYLLVDHLTVPVVGCDSHLGQFAEVCGYTTADTAEVLGHRPAGGIVCASCRLAQHNLHHPLVPIGDGAVAVPACPQHTTAIMDRYHAGSEVHHQVTTGLALD